LASEVVRETESRADRLRRRQKSAWAFAASLAAFLIIGLGVTLTIASGDPVGMVSTVPIGLWASIVFAIGRALNGLVVRVCCRGLFSPRRYIRTRSAVAWVAWPFIVFAAALGLPVLLLVLPALFYH
jgi:lysylphosphatidylglycerol synthetase-like protein (DUF2156 family)